MNTKTTKTPDYIRKAVDRYFYRLNHPEEEYDGCPYTLEERLARYEEYRIKRNARQNAIYYRNKAKLEALKNK